MIVSGADQHSIKRINLIDQCSRRRADASRLLLSLGYHTELYHDIHEVAACRPCSGIILLRNDHENGSAVYFIERMERMGIYLPLVVIADTPSSSEVVASIKAGAIDYLEWPVEPNELRACLECVAEEAKQFAEKRRREIEARNKIARLSNRERQVLGFMSDGHCNKSIARLLDISPRTVEIHRANMLAKLEAHHSVEAVRLKFDAGTRIELT